MDIKDAIIDAIFTHQGCEPVDWAVLVDFLEEIGENTFWERELLALSHAANNPNYPYRGMCYACMAAMTRETYQRLRAEKQPENWLRVFRKWRNDMGDYGPYLREIARLHL